MSRRGTVNKKDFTTTYRPHMHAQPAVTASLFASECPLKALGLYLGPSPTPRSTPVEPEKKKEKARESRARVSEPHPRLPTIATNLAAPRTHTHRSRRHHPVGCTALAQQLASFSSFETSGFAASGRTGVFFDALLGRCQRSSGGLR